jgi:hypothetical protein
LLSLIVSFSGIKCKAKAVAMAACFTVGIVSVLVIARLFDYPFEGELALRPTDFSDVTARCQTFSAIGAELARLLARERIRVVNAGRTRSGYMK